MPYSEQNFSGSASKLRRAELPLVLGGVLVSTYSLIRKSPMIAAGAAFGAVGLLAFKERTHEHEGERDEARQIEAMASFSVRCSVQRAYREWRNFENLPRFMRHLKSVTPENGSRSHHSLSHQWIGGGPLGSRFRWRTEIVDDIEGELISWRSLPGSLVQNSGMIEFRQSAPDRGIVITLRMLYGFPAGALGKTFATAMGRSPEFTVREDLRRFKAFLETGEIPTTAGQPHGPRGVHGHIMHMLLRETSNMAPPGVRRQPSSQRAA